LDEGRKNAPAKGGMASTWGHARLADRRPGGELSEEEKSR
jgi:hypothetical protein